MNNDFITQAKTERAALSALPEVRKYLALCQFLKAYEGIDAPSVVAAPAKDAPINNISARVDAPPPQETHRPHPQRAQRGGC